MNRLNRRRQVDLWSEVFGASAETWPWWSSFKFLDGADWDTPGRVRITSCNPDDPTEATITKTIGMADIESALDACIEAGYADTCTGDRIHEMMTVTINAALGFYNKGAA